MRIADSSGVWLTNKGNYPFVDPENSTRFEPGEQIKATKTAWVILQLAAGVLAEIADPEAPAEAPKKAAK